MKMPELPKRKPKAQATDSRSASRVQAPAFAQDLYKDMRDRRLIIPAVALLVAIVAVPIVLSSPSESSVTPPAPVADPDAVAVEPAVLAVQEIGVRDYRKRLSELEQKNPFGSRFDPKPEKEARRRGRHAGRRGDGIRRLRGQYVPLCRARAARAHLLPAPPRRRPAPRPSR